MGASAVLPAARMASCKHFSLQKKGETKREKDREGLTQSPLNLSNTGQIRIGKLPTRHNNT